MPKLSLKTKMIKYFTDTAEEYEPHDAMRVGWISKESQDARFLALYQCGLNLTSSVFDVGCGVGGFYGFLLKHGFSGRYVGCDLINKNCEDANKLYKSPLFENMDFLEMEIPDKFDFVVASGIFFLDANDWKEVTIATLRKMYNLSKFGIAANFLSMYYEEKNSKNLKYTDPAEIIKVCEKFTKRFALRHDYAINNNDFTIYAYH